MKNKLLYLKEQGFVSTAYYSDFEEQIYSLSSELNQIARKHLFNLTEYNRLARKEIGLKNKIPIYVSPTVLLYKLNSVEGEFYINHFSVLQVCYESGKVMYIFDNFSTLEVTISKRVLDNEIKKIKIILDYIHSL